MVATGMGQRVRGQGWAIPARPATQVRGWLRWAWLSAYRRSLPAGAMLEVKNTEGAADALAIESTRRAEYERMIVDVCLESFRGGH